MEHMVGTIILYGFLGAMAVLVVMNANSFKTAIGAVGGIYTQETTILTGSGYKRPS